MKLPGKLVILGLGVLTTLLAVMVWLPGFGSQLELWCLDWAFRQAAPTTIRDDLVHVDIDDLSIEQLGRWPWPRESLARIIDTLNAAGAECIALDVVFPDAQATRYASEAQSVHGSFKQVLQEAAPPRPIYDDALLSGSIRKAGNVTLGMHVKFDQTSPLPFETDIAAYLKQHPEADIYKCALQTAKRDLTKPLSDKVEDSDILLRSNASLS